MRARRVAVWSVAVMWGAGSMTMASAQAAGSASHPAPDAGSVAPTVAPAATRLVGTIPSSGLRAIGSDLRRLPSLETALVLGVVGAISAGVRHQDSQVTKRAASSPTADRLFEAGEVLGGGALHAGGALATYAAGRIFGRPAVTSVGTDLLRAQLLNGMLTQGIKLSVRRERPDGGVYSFPSGHTSSSFAVATVLGDRFGWKVRVPAYGAAAFVGASRLSENRHYLSDVVFGAAVGIVAGRTIRLGNRLGRGQVAFAVAPIAAPGVAGVSLAWTPGPGK